MKKYIEVLPKNSKFAFLIYLFSFTCWATAERGIDLDKLDQALQTTGLTGQVHGAVDSRDLFVFTYRTPGNFFEHVELPLTTVDAGVRAQMKSLKRQQTVKLFGHLLKNKAPVKHIDVTKMELVQDYHSVVDDYPYVSKTKISEVTAKDELVARVHAIDPGGQVLVIEYKDLVVPVFVKEASDVEFVKKLYRGDKIRLRYNVRAYPSSPVHLEPKTAQDLAGKSALEKLQAVVDFHGKKLEKEGFLVLFPKSPQIIMDTYAVLQEDEEGSAIQMTLANLENPEVFAQIRKKLNEAWNKNITKIENGRNKLVNRGVKVKVKGTGNVIDPGQANAQILLDSADQITVEILP